MNIPTFPGQIYLVHLGSSEISTIFRFFKIFLKNFNYFQLSQNLRRKFSKPSLGWKFLNPACGVTKHSCRHRFGKGGTGMRGGSAPTPCPEEGPGGGPDTPCRARVLQGSGLFEGAQPSLMPPGSKNRDLVCPLFLKGAG